MAALPQVSVLMSVYNGEKFLGQAIDSILGQTFTDFEFIIINDGSIDRTGEILQNYQMRDHRIRIYTQQNSGLIASLNRGCKLARGVYIARMDADDVSLPQRLARQVSFLECHPQVGVVGTGVQIIDNRGNPLYIYHFPTSPNLLKWALALFNPISHPTVMMKRSLVQQVGGYHPDMLIAEDYDLWWRLSKITQLANIPETLLYLRWHSENVTKVFAAKNQHTAIKINQRIIFEMLHQRVPESLLAIFWGRERVSWLEMVEAARLIYRLYRFGVSNKKLTVYEKWLVSKYSAIRLLTLPLPRLWRARLWKLLLLQKSVGRSLWLQMTQKNKALED